MEGVRIGDEVEVKLTDPRHRHGRWHRARVISLDRESIGVRFVGDPSKFRVLERGRWQRWRLANISRET